MNLCRATTAEWIGFFKNENWDLPGLSSLICPLSRVTGQAYDPAFGRTAIKFNREQARQIRLAPLPNTRSRIQVTGRTHRSWSPMSSTCIFRVRHTFEGDVFGSICRIVTTLQSHTEVLTLGLFCSERLPSSFWHQSRMGIDQVTFLSDCFSAKSLAIRYSSFSYNRARILR